MGLFPGSGRFPGGGHGNPLQYSCLENPMDRGAWRARVHWVAKSQTWLKWLSTHARSVAKPRGVRRSTQCQMPAHSLGRGTCNAEPLTTEPNTMSRWPGCCVDTWRGPSLEVLDKHGPHQTLVYESIGCQGRAAPGRSIHPIRSQHLPQEPHGTPTLSESK